jgi:SAM-dependent methyltransferase
MQRVGLLDADDVTTAYADVGRRIHDQIIELLPPDWSLSGRRVLDFGCGAGRVLRHFIDHADCELHGCDVDEPSIRWIGEHLSPPLHAIVNSELPPLPYADDSFDLIYVASVFTHITDAWSAWLLELRRLLNADGVLIATFLGPPMYEEFVGEPWDEARIGMNVIAHYAPWNEGGPFVFHSPWWLERHWGRAFEIVQLRSEGFGADPHHAKPSHGYVVMTPRAASVTTEDIERVDADDPRELGALRDNARLLARRERDARIELAAARAEQERLNAERDAARDAVAGASAQVEAMKATRAWRIAGRYWRLKRFVQAQRRTSA